MTIEINGPNARPPAELVDSSALRPRQPGSGAAPATNTLAGSQDRVSLTDQAAQLQTLESQIANLPVVDTQRVREVQHALATGNFHIDPASVADKLLNFESGLDA
ncbi:MAG: negative regulator of flagellin synthesis FlgM [Pseudomonadota bacterium]